MTRAGHHGPMSATNVEVAALEELQFALAEGPGVEAFRERRPVLVPDLAGADAAGRWPVFVAAALERGAGALMAFPLVLGAADVGVLLMYATRPTILADGSRSSRCALPTPRRWHSSTQSNGIDGMAKATLSNVDPNEPVGIERDFYRSEIYQAAGMAMVQLGVPIDTALARIRGHAFANDVPVLEVARAIVRRDLRMEPDE